MAIYIVLRHPDAEQLWANSWVSGTCLVEAITTDAIVAGQCKDARRTEDYVYVHRCAHGDSPAMIVSKGKVHEVQKLDRAIAIDEALERLDRIDPRQSRIVELRFFAGLNVEEAAEVMGVSPKTIKREWRSAKAWLYREMAAVKSQ